MNRATLCVALAAALTFPATDGESFAAPTDSTVVRSPEATPVVRAERVRDRVRIDGRLDDAAWTAATPATRFLQRDPDEGRPVTERTEVRLLIGDDALYVGARLYDREPHGIRRRLVRRDEDLASDYISVYLDSEHGHLTAYRFDANPAGAYRDAAVSAQGNEDFSWDPVWNVATFTDSLGWTAEMEIPLSQLRYRSGEPVWGIQIARWIDRKQEYAEFAFTPKSEHSDVSRYGHLEGLEGLRNERHVELLPYLLGKLRREGIAPGDPFRDATDRSGAFGGDLRYRFRSGLTLDATAHPDFGQVEVDPAVVNLTAVETFFPEKRPFFIERAELFEFGQTRSNNYFGTPIAFHARRIGREPQRLLTDPSFAFVDAPDVVDIAAAAKLTGRLAGGWSVGVLDAVTPRTEARFLDSLGARRELPVEPLTNYSVARVRRELGGGSTTVGAIATATNRDDSDPALDSLLRSGAYLAGADFNHYLDHRRWSVDGYLLGSTIRGSESAIALAQRSSTRYYQRPDASHLSYDPTRTHLDGMAALLSLNKIGGEHWLGSTTWQDLSPGFENNDLGFISGVDSWGLSSLLLYKEDRPSRLLRNWNVGVFHNDAFNHDGDVTYQGYETQAQATLPNYWYADLRGSWFPWAYDDRLTRGGPLAGIPEGGRVAATVATDSRKSWRFRLHVNSSWNDAGAHGLQLTPSLTLHPSTSLLVRFEPNLQGTRDMSQYVTTIADPYATQTYGSRYVFATLDQRLASLDTRVDWTFSPRLSLQLYVQPFVVSGRYREIKELRAPRTYDFTVYGTHAGTLTRDAGGIQVDPDGAGPAPSFAVQDPDFNFRSLRGNAVLRWEYRPGSALFLVWQQSRVGVSPIGEFQFGRDLRELFEQRPDNTVALKATYWFRI